MSDAADRVFPGRWLEAAWREYGEAIWAERPSVRVAAETIGITRKQARRLVEHIRAHGPRPPSDTAGGLVHLVIPDTHARPGEDLSRFSWLGKLIADVRPDVLVHMGDHYDYASIGRFDRGKLAGEGQRLSAEEEAGDEALDLMHAAFDGWQPKRKVALRGNHEDRAEKYAQDHPELSGYLRPPGAHFEALGWACHDYMAPVVIDGICYSHSHPSGVLGKAIGGMHHAASLIRLGNESCVAAHSHCLDYSVRTTRSGRKLLGLVAGCYVDASHAYAKATQAMWWSGVCVLRDVADGFGDLELWSLDRIKRRYAS